MSVSCSLLEQEIPVFNRTRSLNKFWRTRAIKFSRRQTSFPADFPRHNRPTNQSGALLEYRSDSQSELCNPLRQLAAVIAVGIILVSVNIAFPRIVNLVTFDVYNNVSWKFDQYDCPGPGYPQPGILFRRWARTKILRKKVNFYIYLILFWLYTTLQYTVHIRKTNINVKVDDNFKIILEFPWRWRGFLAEDIQVQDNHIDQIFMKHCYRHQM